MLYTKDGITVSVILDKHTPNKDGLYPVKIRVYHLKKPKYYSTGVCLAAEDYDSLERKRSNESQGIKRSCVPQVLTAQSSLSSQLSRNELHLKSFVSNFWGAVQKGRLFYCSFLIFTLRLQPFEISAPG